MVLLVFRVAVIFSYYSFIQGNRNAALIGAMFTILRALVLPTFQVTEFLSYFFSGYSMASNFTGVFHPRPSAVLLALNSTNIPLELRREI